MLKIIAAVAPLMGLLGTVTGMIITFQAITIWRDELLDEDILLRDVIDLDATFGRSMGEDGEDDYKCNDMLSCFQARLSDDLTRNLFFAFFARRERVI